MSPNEEIPTYGGYFTYLKEAAIEAYIGELDETNEETPQWNQHHLYQ